MNEEGGAYVGMYVGVADDEGDVDKSEKKDENTSRDSSDSSDEESSDGKDANNYLLSDEEEDEGDNENNSTQESDSNSYLINAEDDETESSTTKNDSDENNYLYNSNSDEEPSKEKSKPKKPVRDLYDLAEESSSSFSDSGSRTEEELTLEEGVGHYYSLFHDQSDVKEDPGKGKEKEEKQQKKKRTKKEKEKAKEKKKTKKKRDVEILSALTKVSRNIGQLPDSVWNKRFQELMQLPDSESKYHKLSYLAHDNMLTFTLHFQHAAEVYGRIVISERELPVEQKTIKPLALGGIAGGDKFMVRGILFKYAVDVELRPGLWMYGDDCPNDSFAMKAAGHELRSMARIVDVGAASEGIQLPLLTLVDFRGFRLIAVCVLPVSKETICYGSHDAGRTVHADYAAFNAKFKTIFSRLNLKRHVVANQVLYGPGDVEGHWGADGKLYLLDFARVYCPESQKVASRFFPCLEPRAVFFKMLRPEYVAANPTPLCSDAFSGWLARDPDIRKHNQEVVDATERMVKEVIPSLVKEELESLRARDQEMYLDWWAVHTGESVFMRSWLPAGVKHDAAQTGTKVESLNQRLLHVLHRMHARGINMRYLGLVRHQLFLNAVERLRADKHLYNKRKGKIISCTYRTMLFTEMAARVCKVMIRAIMREKAKLHTEASTEPYRQAILRMFNLFAGNSEASEYFWTSTVLPTFDDFKREDYGKLKGGAEWYIYKAAQEKMKKREESRKASGNQSELNKMDDHNSFFFDPSELVDDDIDFDKLLPMKWALRAKFGDVALIDQEWLASTRTYPTIFQGLLFRRLCDMLAIELADKEWLYDMLNGDPVPLIPKPYEFMDPHLVNISVKVKNTHLVSSSEGLALYLKALALEEAAKKNHVVKGTENYTVLMDKMTRLMKFSKEKLEEALLSIPDSLQTLISLGDVEHWLALNYGEHFYSSGGESASANSGGGEGGSGGSGGGVVVIKTGGGIIGVSAENKGDSAQSGNVLGGVMEIAAETKGKDMAEIVRDYFVDAIKHLSQAMEIFEKRSGIERNNNSPKNNNNSQEILRGKRMAIDSNEKDRLATERKREDHEKLRSVMLKIAQLYCDWSSFPLLLAARQARSDRQDTLWQKAWEQYETLIAFWPEIIQPIFEKDVKRIVANLPLFDLKVYDYNSRRYRKENEKTTTEEVEERFTPKGGDIIASVLKVEALRELHKREGEAQERERSKKVKAEKNKRNEERRQKWEREKKAKAEAEAEAKAKEENKEPKAEIATLALEALNNSNNNKTTPTTATTTGKASPKPSAHRQQTPTLAEMLRESGSQASVALWQSAQLLPAKEEGSGRKKSNSKASETTTTNATTEKQTKKKKEKEKEKGKEKEKKKKRKKSKNVIMGEHKADEGQICTFLRTGEKFWDQPIYGCTTCGIEAGENCLCAVCARVCHDGHKVFYIHTGPAFCDCMQMGLCRYAPKAENDSKDSPSDKRSKEIKTAGGLTLFDAKEVYLMTGNGMYLAVGDDNTTLCALPEVTTRCVFVLEVDDANKTLAFRNVWCQKYVVVSKANKVELQSLPEMVMAASGHLYWAGYMVGAGVGAQWKYEDINKKGKRSLLHEHCYLKCASGEWLCSAQSNAELFLSKSFLKGDKEKAWTIKLANNRLLLRSAQLIPQFLCAHISSATSFFTYLTPTVPRDDATWFIDSYEVEGQDSAGAKMYGKDRATLQCSRGKYLALDEKNQLTFQTTPFYWDRKIQASHTHEVATFANLKTRLWLTAEGTQPIASLTYGPTSRTRHWKLHYLVSDTERENKATLSRLYATLARLYDWKTVESLRAGKFLGTSNNIFM